MSRLEESIDSSKMMQHQIAQVLTLPLAEVQKFSTKLDKKVTSNSAIESQSTVLGIKDEILTVLTHLVNNAVKYTPHGERIAVTYQVTDGQLCLSVADNGIGIGAQHLPRLTERFYRVDASRSSASGGTGLGLAIVNRIIERHKGSLDIISEEGQGSCFTCTFPL